MRRIILTLMIILNILVANDKADTDLFMTYPYFKDITKLETHIFLNSNAEKILYKQGIDDFIKTTLRSKIGKSLNKLKDTKNEKKSNFVIEIITLGPYNDQRDIYSGTVQLTMQIDSFGREYYSKTIRIFNQKSEIQKEVEESIELLLKWFVRDYYKILDFDYSKMSDNDKIFFLFKYRGDFEYYTSRSEIWKTIEKNQKTAKIIFDDVSKNTKRENTKDKNTKYGYTKIKGDNTVVEFWDYSKKPKFKYAKTICVDSNNDGILNFEIKKKESRNFLIGIYEGGDTYYYDTTGVCNNKMQKFYDKKRGISKVAISKNSSSGTGFFISSSGHLLTNYHVIKNAKNIQILYKKKKYNAEIISTDKSNDIAILKINKTTTFLPIAEYPKIEKGENVTSLGFPLIGLQGNELKANFGHINSLSGIQNDIRFLQIDNPTQPGNSGSPLINQKGEVIGVVSARLNQKTTIKYSGTLSQNVNYAIKMDYVLPIIKQNSIKTKKIKYSKKLTDKEIVKKYENSVVLIIASE